MKRQITLLSSQSDKEKVSTLWHETLHLISAEHDDLALTERQVEILEREVVKLFKSNPKFTSLFFDLVRGKIKT